MATKTIPGNGQGTTALADQPSSGPSRLELRLAWARETLGVSAAATQAEVRGAFLAGLALDEFMPRETWHQAYQTLVNEFEGVTDVTEPAEFLRHEAEQLDEEVENFAVRMFSLPVEVRQREHLELCRRTLPESRTMARLEALRPGLAADPSVFSSNAPMCIRLAEHLVDLSTLHPSARAARRFEIIESLGPEISKWETAARIFKSQQPKLAALDEPLIDQLANWSQVQKQVSRPVKADRPIVTHSDPGWNWNPNVRGTWLAIVLGLLVCGSLFRAMSSGSRSTYPTNYSVPPIEYRPRDFTLPSPKIPSKQRLDEILKQIRELDTKYPDTSPSPTDIEESLDPASDTDWTQSVREFRRYEKFRVPQSGEGK